jgi:hypothetical protein
MLNLASKWDPIIRSTYRWRVYDYVSYGFVAAEMNNNRGSENLILQYFLTISDNQIEVSAAAQK